MSSSSKLSCFLLWGLWGKRIIEFLEGLRDCLVRFGPMSDFMFIMGLGY